MHWGRPILKIACTTHPSWYRRGVAKLAALAALAVVGGSVRLPAQAATGTITGTVTDVATHAPLIGATVRITGTQLGTQSGNDGHYTIRGVTPGTVSLQVNRIGYEAKNASATVTAGGTATVNVELGQAAFSLQSVVTTVTGTQSKAEISNTIATVDVASKIAETPVSTTGELLSGRASGVQVISAGATGAGSRVRIRGQSSLSLVNDPLVYVDGVRVDASSAATGIQGNVNATSVGQTGVGTGGSAPSALDNIAPEEIETIDIIKGPAAATLYGTQAANGVILITTKRGKAGATRWNAFSENGKLYDPHKGSYPDLWVSFQHNANGTLSTCTLVQEASNSCKIDSTYHGQVLNNPTLSPLTDGNRSQYGLQVSGGSDKLTFFTSGDVEHEQGPYKMPDGEISRLTAERGSSIGDDQVYPNALKRVNMRTNLNAQLSQKADISVSLGFVDGYTRLPQNEDNGNGLMVDVLGGSARTDLKDPRGVPLLGYRSFPVGDVFAQTTTFQTTRFINGLSGRFYPVSWLNLRANAGYDFSAGNNIGLVRDNEGPFGQTSRQGSINSNRLETDLYTADLGGTATWSPFSRFSAKSSVGIQYLRSYQSATSAAGTQLPPGATTVTAAAVVTASNRTAESITLGTYGEEVLSFADRFFLTGGLRYDGNSAFGSGFSGVYYPKIGASWLLSDESFFPKINALNSVRLRGTYGASGVQPGTTDALRFYTPVKVNAQGVEQSGVSLGALGNPNLKPEYSGEFETGIDVTAFQSKTTIELTYYNKKTTDALIAAPVPPSLGGTISTQVQNIGSIRNQGVELTLNQKLIDNSQVGAEIQLTGSTNKNRVLSLGQGITPINTGNRATQRNAPNYPLYGLWQQTYSYADNDKNGIITANEVKLSDTAVFIGPTFPTHEFALSPRLELFHRKLAIAAQFDHKDGMTKFYNTFRHRCQGGASCEGLWDPNASLADQARAVADNLGSPSYAGFMYNGEFTRLREVSVAYDLPDRFAHAIHSSRAALIGTGRNLHVWTAYPGIDPEATVGNGDQRGNEEYFSTPPLRYFTVRLNLSF